MAFSFPLRWKPTEESWVPEAHGEIFARVPGERKWHTLSDWMHFISSYHPFSCQTGAHMFGEKCGYSQLMDIEAKDGLPTCDSWPITAATESVNETQN